VTDEPALSVEGVGVAFGALVALDGVRLAVGAGDRLGIVGPNGAGKTTLLNVLSGYVRPAQGTVHLFGQEVTGCSPERLARMGVGRSFQLADQFGRLSVLDFMLLGLMTELNGSFVASCLRLKNVRREEERARQTVTEELAIFGLEGIRLSSRLSSLPYGIRKRLDLARAAIGHPRLLLVDEPTSGLSSGECDEMSAVLKTLARQRDLTLVIVDHRVHFVTDLSTSLLALDFGEVIGNGPCAEVLADRRVRRAYFGIAEDVEA
jgi:ABC-type branched-subunit amino acid transport system ATPase component